MNFEFSDEQQLLREQAQSFLADNSSIKKVRETFESDAPYDQELWKKVVELGWTGASIPEKYQGLGLSYLNLCVIAEELIEKNERGRLETKKIHEQEILEVERKYLEVIYSISFRLGRFLTYPVRKPFVSLILPTLERRPFIHSLIRFFRAGIANPKRLKNLLSVRRIKNFLEIIVERGHRGESALQRYESILKIDDSTSSFISSSKGVDEDIAPDRIVLRTSSDPIVSVLIPVFNQAKYTLNCQSNKAELISLAMRVQLSGFLQPQLLKDNK